jgi:hypothetical protein
LYGWRRLNRGSSGISSSRATILSFLSKISIAREGNLPNCLFSTFSSTRSPLSNQSCMLLCLVPVASSAQYGAQIDTGPCAAVTGPTAGHHGRARSGRTPPQGSNSGDEQAAVEPCVPLAAAYDYEFSPTD